MSLIFLLFAVLAASVALLIDARHPATRAMRLVLLVVAGASLALGLLGGGA